MTPSDATLWDERGIGQRPLARKYGLTRHAVRIAWAREKARLEAADTPVTQGSQKAETPAPATERPTYEVRENGRIFINWQTQTIVSDLGEFGTVVFSFDRHAAMRRRYADDWENNRETIPEIARDFDLPPAAFARYKELHRWTHASDPFTDQEWAGGLSVEEAVGQTLESHRRAFHKTLQKEKWATTIADAERWRRFEQTALQPMMAAIQAHAPRYTPPKVSLRAAPRAFDVVFCAPDLHYGKGGWADEVGQGYSRGQARELLISKTQRVLQAISTYGQPARILTAVGNDWFHIDNDAGNTTDGTRQDLEGSPHQIMWEGSELAISQLDMLRQLAPVEVFYVAGNHDRLIGWSLLHSIYAWYHSARDVRIHRSPAPRQYTISGASLVGFTHGDGAKFADLPILMAAEARAEWGVTRHRAMFTGHLHHEKTLDRYGVVIYQMPSLSGIDRWHVRNGYIGARRGLAAYILDHQDGVVGTIMAPVTEQVDDERAGELDN